MAHSKGDDNRPRELVEEHWRNDPLTLLLESDAALEQTSKHVEATLEEIVRGVCGQPAIQASEPSALPPSDRVLSSVDLHADTGTKKGLGRVAEELNRALHEMMAEHSEVILIGEDLLDPYGGAFKVSRGLSSKYPDQVLSTPIAEAGIAGVSNGLALAGMLPVAEIMFADFVTLAADQLINFAAKFYYMYGDQVNCPLTLRLVSGAGRGYGPTHSQSLERLFCGIPGLRVVALSQRHDSRQLLTQVVLHDNGPKVFVENKLLYALAPLEKPPVDLELAPCTKDNGDYPPLCYRPRQGRKADVTLVTYGGMTGIAEAAMQRLLEEEELSFEYLVLTQLWPLDVTEIAASVRRTRKLVVVEENVVDFGVSSAVIAAVAQDLPEGFACRAVGAQPVPIPSVRHLEDQVLPSIGKVVAAVTDLV